MSTDSARTVAITGATGFIGRRLAMQFARAGWNLRVLVRRDPGLPEWRAAQAAVVVGSLEQPASLERLVDGADAVVNLAGAIKATRLQGYLVPNRDGARRVAAAAARRAPRAHLVQVSSLAAREPQLSDYAHSKREGERAAREAFDGNLTVLRPPAVYGPGDPETLVFFQLARRSLVPLLGSPEARAAMIHVDDLCGAIVAVAARGGRPGEFVPTDDRPEGYSWREILSAAARAVGNRSARFVHAPTAVLRSMALLGDVARGLGSANMLHSQKLRELRHPDWSVPPAQRLSVEGWAPRFDLDAGFADAVAAYRSAGWLPPH